MTIFEEISPNKLSGFSRQRLTFGNDTLTKKISSDSDSTNRWEVALVSCPDMGHGAIPNLHGV